MLTVAGAHEVFLVPVSADGFLHQLTVEEATGEDNTLVTPPVGKRLVIGAGVASSWTLCSTSEPAFGEAHSILRNVALTHTRANRYRGCFLENHCTEFLCLGELVECDVGCPVLDLIRLCGNKDALHVVCGAVPFTPRLVDFPSVLRRWVSDAKLSVPTVVEMGTSWVSTIFSNRSRRIHAVAIIAKLSRDRLLSSMQPSAKQNAVVSV